MYLKQKGSESDADYPYKARDGNCKYDKSKVVVTPKDCHILSVGEDAYAQKLRQMGPLSIGELNQVTQPKYNYQVHRNFILTIFYVLPSFVFLCILLLIQIFVFTIFESEDI